MLRVYEKNLNAATLADALVSNGMGFLTHPLEARLHRVINGDWSLTLTYPLDAPNAGLLQAERLICVDDGRSEQLYRIARRSPKSTRNGRVIEVEAPHIVYDLAHKMIENIETKEDPDAVDGINARTAMEQILQGTGFSVGEVTVDSATLDYLDILQLDVMSCLKDQVLEKWGGELVFDNFTVHLLKAMGEDRRYPIRDGRNIEEITVTESFEPVVTRLHIRGYENANIEEINGGKDYIDSELASSYSHIREGYADFSDEDDPQELLRLGKAKLTELEVPEITYDIKLAELRGSVQYAAYRRLEAYGLGDTAVLHSDTIDRDVILRCSELETDALTGRNLSVKLGNADAKLMNAITAGASANDRLARVLDAKGYLQAEKIAGKLNLVRITNLETEIANILNARIGDATITSAQINDLTAEVARIMRAKIGELEVDWGSINRLKSAVANIASAEIQSADIGFARIKDVAADEALIRKGTGREFYFDKLAASTAQMVDLTVGKLCVKAADGKYYNLTVDISTGTVRAAEVTPGAEELSAGQTAAGQHIVETNLTVTDLNATSAKAVEALIGKLTAGRIDVDQLFAREATIAKLNAMDITGNEGIRLIAQKADGNEGQIAALSDQITATVTALEGVENALDGKADAETLTRLSTQLRQTAESLTATITRTEELEGGADATAAALREYQLAVRIDAEGVSIGKSDSDLVTRITNNRMSFLQAGTEVAYISSNQLHIMQAHVEQSLRLGQLVCAVDASGSGVTWTIAE